MGVSQGAQSGSSGSPGWNTTARDLILNMSKVWRQGVSDYSHIHWNPEMESQLLDLNRRRIRFVVLPSNILGVLKNAGPPNHGFYITWMICVYHPCEKKTNFRGFCDFHCPETGTPSFISPASSSLCWPCCCQSAGETCLDRTMATSGFPKSWGIPMAFNMSQFTFII
jgi:hypothetical protein